MKKVVHIIAILVISGCASPSIDDPCLAQHDPSRMAQIQVFLQRDNAIWLHQDPTLVSDKLCKMAGEIDLCTEYVSDRSFIELGKRDDPYAFMRGTVGLFMSDIARPGRRRLETSLIRSPDAAQILLVGDPHPENLGTVFRTPLAVTDEDVSELELTLAWFDFDAAAFGAYTTDLRRAANGLMAYVQGVESCTEGCRADLVSAMAQTYARTIHDLAEERTPLQPQFGQLFGSLFSEALDEGRRRKKLFKCTQRIADGSRRLRIGDDKCDGLVLLNPREEAESKALIRAYRETRETPIRVLDVARRLGQGVSSLAATRYIILFDMGASGSDDDALLNVRMVVEPPSSPAIASNRGAHFRGNTERIREATRRLWSREQNDPNFASMTVGNRVFKAHSWTSYFQDLNREKMLKAIRMNEAGVDDLIQLAHWVGFELAGAHARGPLAKGGQSLDAIALDLAGYESNLENELLAIHGTDYAQLVSDHRAFQCLLTTQGLMAGMDRVAMDPN